MHSIARFLYDRYAFHSEQNTPITVYNNNLAVLRSAFNKRCNCIDKHANIHISNNNRNNID